MHWASEATRGSACSSYETLPGSPLKGSRKEKATMLDCSPCCCWGFHRPWCGTRTSRINNSYFLLSMGQELEHLLAGNSDFEVMIVNIFVCADTMGEGSISHEEICRLTESAKSMSSNCVLTGAVESRVMKIDWIVITSEITSLVKYEYRQNRNWRWFLLTKMRSPLCCSQNKQHKWFFSPLKFFFLLCSSTKNNQ